MYVYLDDVLVESATEEQHERDLRQLFGALRHFGLVLNINKCVFGVRQIQFLGHTVSEHGIRPLPGKVASITQFELPRSVRALPCFLGLVNFYRRFLPGIAAVLRPLTDALAGAPHQLRWNEEMTSAFQLKKHLLTEATMLLSPSFGRGAAHRCKHESNCGRATLDSGRPYTATRLFQQTHNFHGVVVLLV